MKNKVTLVIRGLAELHCAPTHLLRISREPSGRAIALGGPGSDLGRGILGDRRSLPPPSLVKLLGRAKKKEGKGSSVIASYGHLHPT